MIHSLSLPLIHCWTNLVTHLMDNRMKNLQLKFSVFQEIGVWGWERSFLSLILSIQCKKWKGACKNWRVKLRWLHAIPISLVLLLHPFQSQFIVFKTLISTTPPLWNSLNPNQNQMCLTSNKNFSSTYSKFTTYVIKSTQSIKRQSTPSKKEVSLWRTFILRNN